MVRLLCSTCCPWITPGDSLLIYGSRNSQQMHREQGKRARKLRVMGDDKHSEEHSEGWQGQVSRKEESLTDASHWKKNRVVQVVGPNSALWEIVSWSPSFLGPADRFLVITSGIFGFHPCLLGLKNLSRLEFFSHRLWGWIFMTFLFFSLPENLYLPHL